ncbi:hypothetical protein FOL47_009890 [Perkinsus chesapeaki]|uniref:Uncharacterized protein n=1 Tax=Perkinsus chesapeaki TaxID=330153 RepID=A0A7J6MQX5_PERCH|nr:hypothetical protein FOL47_009890 [Perkinsus chesapeaki]
MLSLKSVITLPDHTSVLACFDGEQEIILRVAASVSAVEFVKDFEVSDILRLREAIGITGAEQTSEEMRKAAENFATEMLLPALADSEGCSIECDASDSDIALVHYFYTITNLGRISGRLDLRKTQRQGELIAALATEINRLKNDIDKMKADMKDLEATGVYMRNVLPYLVDNIYTSIGLLLSTPVLVYSVPATVLSFSSSSGIPLSPSTPTPSSRPPSKRRHHMSVVNPNRRLSSSRKRTKGLEFSDDDDDDGD